MSLRYEGFEVLQAQDGKVGLQKALDEAPDLIVLDIMMPQLNGYEVMEELRERDSQTPVIVLSAKGHGDRQDHRPQSRRRRLRGEAVRPAGAARAHSKPCCAAATARGESVAFSTTRLDRSARQDR